MGTSAIPVDLLNPGQVFACLGFVETAEVLWGGAKGAFGWSDEVTAYFRFSADGVDDPCLGVLEFLAQAEVIAIIPDEFKALPEKWKKALEGIKVHTPSPRKSYPISYPLSAATVPAELRAQGKTLQIAHWGDDLGKTGLDNIKFWAGSGGYPGAKLLLDALMTLPRLIAPLAVDPFNFSAEQSSSFRFDWRRDYIPLDIGFSLNKHSADRFTPAGYPLVEILAAIGLSFARPSRTAPDEKLSYRYGVLGFDQSGLFPPPLLRASLGGASNFPFSLRLFQMKLGWPGKEGQARCITTVSEESR